MEPVISIIIPVYNVKKYLCKCIDSVLSQTFNEYEIIIVDDGSTDGSSDLCDEIAKTDSRIKVYHKENGGLSSARNFGIEHANGKYLGFIDSDDYIDKDMYQVLYNNLIKEDADISMCALYDIYKGKSTKINKKNDYYIVDSQEAIRIVLEAEITSVTAVNKLYKRELFNNVRYKVGKTAEDAFAIVELLDQCKRVVITTKQLYYYVHRENSITTTKFNPKSLNVIEAYEMNYNIIKEKYPQLIDVAKMRVIWANFWALDKLVMDEASNNDEEFLKIKKTISNNMLFILKNKNFKFSRKLSVIALIVNKRIYKKMVSIYNNKNKTEN